MTHLAYFVPIMLLCQALVVCVHPVGMVRIERRGLGSVISHVIPVMVPVVLTVPHVQHMLL